MSPETKLVCPTVRKELITQLRAHPPARAQNVMVVIGIASTSGQELNAMRDAFAEVLEEHFLVKVSPPVKFYKSTKYANCLSVLMNFLGIACGARTIDQTAVAGKTAKFNDCLEVCDSWSCHASLFAFPYSRGHMQMPLHLDRI